MAKGKYQNWIKPESLDKLENWARNGLTDEQIAKNMGIGKTTLYDWKKKHGNIAKALKNGKEVADYEVENELFKRATGKCVVIETKKIAGKNNEKIEYIIEKTLPPDVTAIIYWLKNRKPLEWREKASEYQLERLKQEQERLALDQRKQDEKW